ncbi:SCO7613 C-terminal domain-containing membrane protein [Microbacterium sp. A94]|uniref:SCO7613 C-terminal domain-containing membrane protein n=1 Tax=Microbacterium sp. A94 TaxID=3450717 RepID=UPI003F434303
MTAVSETVSWGEAVARHLLDGAVCPVCASRRLESGCCAHCGADLRGSAASEVWAASVSAAAAIRGRNQLIERIPRMGASVDAVAGAVTRDAAARGAVGGGLHPTLRQAQRSDFDAAATGAAGNAQRSGVDAPPAVQRVDSVSAPAAQRADSVPAPNAQRSEFDAAATAPAAQRADAAAPRQSATVQSVLAIAGAGLFAIAALIFTFLNPELSDRATRSVVVGLVTLIFLGGAWLLARRGLQFSAEAVGALGLVFVALDVYSFAQLGGSTASTWLISAGVTAGASGVMFAAGKLSHVRVWRWAALIGAALVPAQLGYAAGFASGAGSGFFAAVGHLGTAFLAAVLIEFWPRIAPRMLTAVQIIVTLTAVPLAVVGAWSAFGGIGMLLSISLVLALVAAHAVFASRHLLRHWWSLVAGGAATTALTVAVTSPVADLAAVWLPAAVPATAAFGLALLAATPLPRSVVRFALSLGSLIVIGAIALMPLVYAATTAVDALADVVRGSAPVVVNDTWGMAALIGMVGIAAGLALFGGLTRDRIAQLRAADSDAATATAAVAAAAPTTARTATTAVAAVSPAATSTPTAAIPTPTPTRHPLLHFTASTDVLAIASAALAVLTLACSNLLPLPARLVVVLGAAAAAAAALLTARPRRAASANTATRPKPEASASIAARLSPATSANTVTANTVTANTVTANTATLIAAIHAGIAVATLISWLDPVSAPVAGIGILAVLVLASRTLPSGIRFLHVGVGFAYALICLAQALAQSLPQALGFPPLGSIAVLCLVASAALVSAIVVTFIPRIGSRSWHAVLVVTAVPFAAGIVQVVFERSGWTALSTALMFALALSLLLTRRPGLGIVLRTIAAGMLVPTVAVVVVCLGAQVLAVSASPVTLPIIAAIVALVLPSTTLIRDALRTNGLPADAAASVRIAIEASALLTCVIATGLALAREAAGLGTTFLVLVILGVGSAASAAFTRRRYGWWVAGAAFTGALWCVWTMNGVDLLEAYLLPPALAAAVTAAILAARGVEVRGLYSTGLAIALLPSLALLVLIEPDARTAAQVPWRAIALLTAGGVLLGLGWGLARLGRRLRIARLRMLVRPTLVAAGVAAIAGPVQGIRMPEITVLHGVALFFACFGVSALAAIILALAGRGIRRSSPASSGLRRTRWMLAPAVLALAAGTWNAIERDWGSIWLMWALMVGLLALMLVAAVRAGRSGRAGQTTLPPVWFLFGVAFVTAVVAWSPRDLRVEWFSLPLGLFLLAAGVHALRHAPADAGGGSVNSWPLGFRSSWALLAPGIVTMMSASIVATFTDPLTWRAILVMVLALAAIMVGAGRRLAAPFILGMLVLPIENIFVFAVQIGRGVESMPWWITLAVIGAVLLIIAVTYERRSGDASTVAARIRDLR